MIDPKLSNYIIGLCISCPYTHALDTCPLNSKRDDLSFSDQMDFAEHLNLESAMQIIAYHKNCANSR